MSDTAAPTERDALVAAARDSIAKGSKSFAAASLLFDPETRARAWLLYAWCRRCDDIADGQDHGHGMTRVADAPARLAELTEKTEAALAGRVVGDPAFDALRVVVAETGMPHRWPRDLIAGFALDAEDWRPETEDDLYRYCYHVAGVVGCMMAVTMGVAPDDDAVLDRACDLGMAFQLANIARDIAEDAGAGRHYLPREWLAYKVSHPMRSWPLAPAGPERAGAASDRPGRPVRGERADGHARAILSLGMGRAVRGGDLRRDRPKGCQAGAEGLGQPGRDRQAGKAGFHHARRCAGGEAGQDADRAA